MVTVSHVHITTHVHVLFQHGVMTLQLHGPLTTSILLMNMMILIIVILTILTIFSSGSGTSLNSGTIVPLASIDIGNVDGYTV